MERIKQSREQIKNRWEGTILAIVSKSGIPAAWLAFSRKHPRLMAEVNRREYELYPFGVYCVDLREKQVFYANTTLMKMFGCSSLEELQARYETDDLYYNPEDREKWLRTIAKQGALASFETQMRRSDGTFFWVSDTAVSVHCIENEAHFVLGYLEDVTWRKKEEERTRELARRDGLTGLYNRRYFDEEGQRIFNEAKQNDTPLCLIIIDIDHFKEVNDRWGHPSGDKVLKRIAANILSRVKEEDLVARYGEGDEIVILTQVDDERAQQIAERIRELVEITEQLNGLRIEVDGIQKSITLSLGVAEIDPTMTSLGDLTTRADLALYHSKHRRNTVTVYNQKEIKNCLVCQQRPAVV
jgi:diguanylate cyclase (GGDEF)-like protein/PAS domain S-box-containing protein